MPKVCNSFAILAVALTVSGCVDTFGGSNIQMTLSPGVQVASRNADDDLPPLAGAQVPFGAKFSFYMFRNETGDDASTAGGYAFHIEDFFIQPVINQSSPCFIELADTRYPGLHVTQFLAKWQEDTGIVDPRNAPDGATEEQITDVLLAERRNRLLDEFEGLTGSGVKAVTSFSTFRYPTSANYCVEDNPADPAPDRIPPPQCTGEESNRRRLALCEALWDANPDFYEGSDKVLTLPLNGRFRGTVTGSNPANQGPIGGVQFFVDEVVEDFDYLAIHWQYVDYDGDGQPDYPANFENDERELSPVGYHFMSGTPVRKTRGVINVPMRNRFYSASVTGEAVIFPDLDEDNVHF